MANDNLNIQLQEINKLPKTEDETGLFIVASQEISTNPKAVTYPLKNKADVSYVEKLEKKVKKIEDATTNDKGYFSTEAELLAAFPSPTPGNYANVAGVLYECKNKGSWSNTGTPAPTPELDLNGYARTETEEGTVIRSGELAQTTGQDAEKAVSQKTFTDASNKLDLLNSTLYGGDIPVPVSKNIPYNITTVPSDAGVLVGDCFFYENMDTIVGDKAITIKKLKLKIKVLWKMTLLRCTSQTSGNFQFTTEKVIEFTSLGYKEVAVNISLKSGERLGIGLDGDAVRWESDYNNIGNSVGGIWYYRRISDGVLQSIVRNMNIGIDFEIYDDIEESGDIPNIKQNVGNLETSLTELDNKVLKITRLSNISDLDNVDNGIYSIQNEDAGELPRVQIYKDKYFDSSFNLLDSIWGIDKIDAVICEFRVSDYAKVSTYSSSTTSLNAFLLDENKNLIKSVPLSTVNSAVSNFNISRENAVYLAINDNKGFPFSVQGYLGGSFFIRQYVEHGVTIQDKYDEALNKIEYRNKDSDIWGEWLVIPSGGSNVGKDYSSPNDFTNGTQIARINAAIQYAVQTSKKVVIPRVDTVLNTDKWLIDSAIVLPSDIIIELNNCHIQQSDICRDNVFRTANVEVGKITFETLKNIHIRGIGTVILEGADNPRSTGDWSKQLTLNSNGGFVSYGSDAGKAGQNQYGGWLNNTFCFVYVDKFSISNVVVREPHAWGMIAAYCTDGIISDITIEGNGYRMINGVKQYIRNQGAFIAVQGCRDLEFNNFYGFNSDDIIEIGTLLWTARTAQANQHPAGEQNNISPTGDVYIDEGDDTYNIVIRNVFAKAEAENIVFALIKFGPSNLQKQYNITVDNVFSTKPALITFDYYNTQAGKTIAHSFRNIGSNITFWCRNANATIPQYSTFRDIWFVGTGEIFDTYILNGKGNVFENTRKITI